MSACLGSYKPAIRRHPETASAECPECGTRFDYNDLAGEKRNVPLHSPAWRAVDVKGGR